MRIRELIEATNADVISLDTNSDKDFCISTDTRTLKPGDFYLPLKGASFDGEKFIFQAFEKGAVGAFCTKELETKKTLLKVDNTLTAYLKLAKYRRNKINPTVVAITGSSGKTTTKELISSVLSEKYKTFKTPLNHNNEIGFCQTIFEMGDDTEVLILEMGMRGLGEIELLSKYSEPDITVICNVGTAHIGRLGSKENIAKAKCEIVKYQRGNLFIAHDDKLIRDTVNFSGKKIFYSLNDVNILEKTANYSKFIYKNNEYELNVGGNYNITNALSAIIAGENMGLTQEQIKTGLKKYSPIEKRWESVNANGIEVINDSYNANPESMRAFIDTICELYQNYTIVLGDMGELGENEVQYHRELGEYINSKLNFNKNAQIITIGTLSSHITGAITKYKTAHFNTIEDAIPYIKQSTNKDDILFLKASRSMKFEKIIQYLCNNNK